MEYLRSLASSVEPSSQTLPSGRIVSIQSWLVRFPDTDPPRLPSGVLRSTYTNKPLVRVANDSLFGELAIARCLSQDGWTAVWADTFHGGKFWSGMPHLSTPVRPSASVQRLLDNIASINGGSRGCFDVIAWLDGRIIFLEYKGPKDRPNRNELQWIDAALEAGVRAEDLFFVGARAR